MVGSPTKKNRIIRGQFRFRGMVDCKHYTPESDCPDWKGTQSVRLSTWHDKGRRNYETKPVRGWIGNSEVGHNNLRTSDELPIARFEVPGHERSLSR